VLVCNSDRFLLECFRTNHYSDIDSDRRSWCYHHYVRTDDTSAQENGYRYLLPFLLFAMQVLILLPKTEKCNSRPFADFYGSTQLWRSESGRYNSEGTQQGLLAIVLSRSAGCVSLCSISKAYDFL